VGAVSCANNGAASQAAPSITMSVRLTPACLVFMASPVLLHQKDAAGPHRDVHKNNPFHASHATKSSRGRRLPEACTTRTRTQRREKCLTYTGIRGRSGTLPENSATVVRLIAWQDALQHFCCDCRIGGRPLRAWQSGAPARFLERRRGICAPKPRAGIECALQRAGDT
jgi:hypothetical protein